ncbi:hypothetical protein [Microbulbifer spongiae]|uniref:Zinc ribbon domain-containing protein n=1 Tax=Microbulbifer spongiae TaxID=2944933 RepID=A0ABY9EG84_9GAMM|nr:hypothetical protein [Microbulbifer sp. MI-G]WKD51108.1 hypothetical protein M8T91_06705 [Microbulbifer sp. MI-G]
MSWLWDAFQQSQISDNQKRSSDAKNDSALALRSVRELEEKLDRLSLLCHALFEELERTTGFSEAQLKEKMLEIDLRDGKLDGKVNLTAGKKCPDCGHQIKKSRPNCFYCGASLQGIS